MPDTVRQTSSLLLITGVVFCGGLAWLNADHYPPWLAFYNDFAAFLAVWLLIAWLAITDKPDNPIQPRLPWTVLVIAAIAAIPLVQALTGLVLFPGDAWIASAYLVGLAATYSTGFLLGTRDNKLLAGAFAWLCLVAALLSTAIALCQWLQLERLAMLIMNARPGRAPYANLGMQNHLATLLCIGLASLAYLWMTRKINGYLSIALSVILIFGVAMTQSRTPWLGAGFLLIWWAVKRHSVPELPGKILCLLVLFYVLLVHTWPEVAQTATEIRLPAPKAAQLGEREAMWLGMLDAAWRAPWWGYGWNQVSAAQFTIAADYVQPSKFSHSHNLLLDLLLWNGIPLGGLIIVCLGTWLAARAWHCNSRESWFALLAIGFVLVHAMLEFPLEYAYFLLPAGILAGLIDADQKMTAQLPLPKPAVWGFLAVSAAFMGMIWHEYRIVEDDYRLMRFETLRIGTLKAEQKAPDIHLLTQLREDLRMARSLARENMSADELEWMRKITYRYPYYSNLFRYGLSLALNGQRDMANLEFRRLRNLFGENAYGQAKEYVELLAATRHPSLRDWRLP